MLSTVCSSHPRLAVVQGGQVATQGPSSAALITGEGLCCPIVSGRFCSHGCDHNDEIAQTLGSSGDLC